MALIQLSAVPPKTALIGCIPLMYFSKAIDDKVDLLKPAFAEQLICTVARQPSISLKQKAALSHAMQRNLQGTQRSQMTIL